MPTQTFIEGFKKQLDKPLLSTPALWVTRRRDEDSYVLKRTESLAAKSNHREPHPKAQARKVMMRRLGFEVETAVPDEATFDEFQEVFSHPLLPSK